MSDRALIKQDDSLLDVNLVHDCVSGLQTTRILESMDQNFFQRSFGSSLTPIIYGPKVKSNYLPSINFVPPGPPPRLQASNYFHGDLVASPSANPAVNQQRSSSLPAPVNNAPVKKKKKNKGSNKYYRIRMSKIAQAKIKKKNSTSSAPVCQQASMLINAVKENNSKEDQKDSIENSINMSRKRKRQLEHSVHINNANKKMKEHLEDNNSSIKETEICLQSNANENLEKNCISKNTERQKCSEKSINVNNKQDAEQTQHNLLKMFVEIGRLREKLDHLEKLLLKEFKPL